MPNNTGGWKGGHTCEKLAPKCEVTTSIFWGCGGQIRKCKKCEFYFCWSHRKPGYKNGHFCSIGCDTTFGNYCVGTRNDLQTCPLCKDDKNSYKYCAYHMAPVDTIVSLKAKKKGDDEGQGGHVCKGYTKGSVFFGDSAADYASILVDATAAVLTLNPGPIAKKFAAKTLKITIGELKTKFGITDEQFTKSAESVKNIVDQVLKGTTLIKNSIEKDEKKLEELVKQYGDDAKKDYETIQDSLKIIEKLNFDDILNELNPAADKKDKKLANGIRGIRNLSSKISSQLQSMVDDISDADKDLKEQFEELTKMINVFLPGKDGKENADIKNIKDVIGKIDTGLNLKGKLTNMIPGVENMPEEFISLLLSEADQAKAEAKKLVDTVEAKVKKAKKEVTDLYAKMDVKEKIAQVVKAGTIYLQTFFDIIGKVARIIEIYTQMVQFIHDVEKELDKPDPDYGKLVKMGTQCVDFTKALFMLCGCYDVPKDVGGTTWDLENEKDDADAKLKSIDIGDLGNNNMDPRNGSVVDGKMQDLLMDLLYERKENMQKLERTIEMMQGNISRLEAEQPQCIVIEDGYPEDYENEDYENEPKLIQDLQERSDRMHQTIDALDDQLDESMRMLQKRGSQKRTGRSNASRIGGRPDSRSRSRTRMSGQSVASRNNIIDPKEEYYV